MPIEPSSTRPPPYRWRIFPAVAVISIGMLFLLGNLGYDLAFFRRGNWWAWFILIGALAPLIGAWETWRRRGRIDSDVLHYVLASGAVVLVAAMFLLALDWTVWWPLFVILGGLFTLLPHRRRYRSCWYGDAADDPPARR